MATLKSQADRLKVERAKRGFLEAFAETGNHNLASRAIHAPPGAYRVWRKDDPSFDAALADLESYVTDRLEGVAYKMARDGDGPMLRYMLTALRPDKYGRQRVEHSGTLSLTFEEALAEIDRDRKDDEGMFGEND